MKNQHVLFQKEILSRHQFIILWKYSSNLEFLFSCCWLTSVWAAARMKISVEFPRPRCIWNLIWLPPTPLFAIPWMIHLCLPVHATDIPLIGLVTEVFWCTRLWMAPTWSTAHLIFAVPMRWTPTYGYIPMTEGKRSANRVGPFISCLPAPEWWFRVHRNGIWRDIKSNWAVICYTFPGNYQVFLEPGSDRIAVKTI